MSKKYIFDSHKLVYQIDRVNDFLKKGDCFPLYMEISIAGNCNHRCVFCAYDYIGYPSRKLETGRLLKFIDEIAECGVKSVLYAGEGEPLLHPDLYKFAARAKDNGIDVGIYTNGQLLKSELSERLLPLLTFVRFSFNGGTRDNYADIHRVRPEVYDKVVDNIRKAVVLKRKKKLGVDIGLQYVLLPENIKHLISAVRNFKDAGIDYFVIKPFVLQSWKQFYRMKDKVGLDRIADILDKAESFSDRDFKVVGRRDSFENYGKRNYRHCYGTAFISVLNSAGDVTTCLPYWDKKEFIFGNIYESTFRKIWLGEKRKKIKRSLEQKMDIKRCPPNCRANAVNEFLWEIKNPSIKHVNFI